MIMYDDIFSRYQISRYYYLCSENKGADQLHSYCEADMCLCFRLCRLLVIPSGGSYDDVYSRYLDNNLLELIPDGSFTGMNNFK